jgi:cytochrome b pre-mRNA-processing protein 3
MNGKYMNLKRLFRRGPPPERRLYEAIVAAARRPHLYEDVGVADTVDGRFDMIALHTYLAVDRLRRQDKNFCERLIEELFADMDRSLREMGVGDLSVGKKVRRMAEAFYGRVTAYERALAEGDDAMKAALARNVFPDGAPDQALDRLLAEIARLRGALSAAPAERLLAGEFPVS